MKLLFTLLSRLSTGLLLTLSASGYAQLCTHYDGAVRVGTLDPSLPEASGLAVSRHFEDRLYHINDSGRGPYFYLTGTHGENTQRVRIKGFSARDADLEDMGLGPCDVAPSCLFIGDIGDNLREREELELLVIEEQETYSDEVTPYRRVRFRYPDGPHNAEGLAVHPNGDVYLLTKEESFFRPAPSRLYRLPREAWEEGEGVQVLEAVGSLPLPLGEVALLSGFNRVATSFDISPDGARFLVLTYGGALEVVLDLSERWRPLSLLQVGKDYRTIDLKRLPQQESVAYEPGGESFLYTSETLGGTGGEIVRVACEVSGE